MTEPNLQEIHEFLIGLAQKAGPKIASANPSSVDTKKNSSDLVTETDKAVEDLISSSCKSAYPDYADTGSLLSHSFLGEETSTSGRLTASPTFVVDPIDGTTNFVHAHPYISISMAFVRNFKPDVGVVYNPFTQHLYTAIKGQGAYLTAPKIPTSFPIAGQKVESTYERQKLPLRSPPPSLPDLSHALIAVEYGNERSGNNWQSKIGTFNALGRAKTEKDGAMVQSVRSLGSAALNCCSVARGDIDVYWEGGCWAWDVAAGWIIVEEAGGMVVGGNNGEWEPKVDGRRYLVLRAGVEKGIVEEFWKSLQDLAMILVQYRIVSVYIFFFLSFSTAIPTLSLLDDNVIQLPSLNLRNPPQNPRRNPSTLQPRLPPLSDPSDLFTSIPPEIADFLTRPPTRPPRANHHLTLTSYTAFLSNTADPTSDTNASIALASFYNGAAASIAGLIRRNDTSPRLRKIAFGGRRIWLNFYAAGEEEVLEWKDLEWCVGKWVGWNKQGMVGKWTGLLLPPGKGEGVKVELILLERLRGEVR
ncbi:MAG: hypothetical protein Q9169_004342 [Polycauliona sp. 2 TL-2023]